MNEKKTIYLDYAAATPVLAEVFEAMQPYFMEQFGNPSSVHGKGQESRMGVDKSRRTVAEILNCNPREIIFTGSGTESDNLAIQGVCRAHGKGHIIVSSIEHSAVLNTVEYLEQNHGFEVTYLEVGENGIVNPGDVASAIRKDTILCSVMYANNEIGTINNIAEIGRICREANVLFHTDACQAGGALELDVEKLNVDMMTLNGSKIYGPKGIGILYRKQGIKLVPMIFGGEGQEHRLRAGTENVAGIIGIAKALEIAEEWRNGPGPSQMAELRDYAIEKLLTIPDSYLNGERASRLPNNVNISFAGIDGATLLMRLDMEGVYLTSGSACTSGSLEPSHVLRAIGRDSELATGGIRITLGRTTSKEDLDYAIEVLEKVIGELRESSPTY